MGTYLFPQIEGGESIFASIGIENPDTGKLYTGLIGIFQVICDRGMQYMLILYVYDTNTILVELIKTRSDTEIMPEYDVLYNTLENAGHAPKLNITSNEASTLLKPMLHKIITVVRLLPPHSHRRNATERAIGTFKNIL